MPIQTSRYDIRCPKSTVCPFWKNYFIVSLAKQEEIGISCEHYLKTCRGGNNRKRCVRLRPLDQKGETMNAMQEMLKRENVQIVDSCKDWQDAIHVAVQPLVDGGYVKPEYIDGVIENAHKFGPYFVLAPDLALIHARPEQGVIKRQLAVTVLRKGVEFKTGEPCRLLVTLAAEDPNSHIDVMRVLATMFANPDNIERVCNAKSADEVYDLFVNPPEA